MKASLALLGVSLCMVSVPALAGAKEDAYAKCAWELAPISAANWLPMPLPERHLLPKNITREYALQQRLDAACFDRLVAEGVKRPRSLSVKKVRLALERTRPADLPDSERDPEAFVCFRYFMNDTAMENPAEMRWGYGTDRSKSQLGMMSLVFAGKDGKQVALAKDGGLEKCQIVNSDGSLTDA